MGGPEDVHEDEKRIKATQVRLKEEIEFYELAREFIKYQFVNNPTLVRLRVLKSQEINDLIRQVIDSIIEIKVELLLEKRYPRRYSINSADWDAAKILDLIKSD